MSTTATKPTSVTFEGHDMLTLSLTLQHELERLHARFINPTPLGRDLIHNTRGAAESVFKLLKATNPGAAESWREHHGWPGHWGTYPATCHCAR